MAKAFSGLVGLLLLLPLVGAQEGFRKIGVAESQELENEA